METWFFATDFFSLLFISKQSSDKDSNSAMKKKKIFFAPSTTTWFFHLTIALHTADVRSGLWLEDGKTLIKIKIAKQERLRRVLRRVSVSEAQQQFWRLANNGKISVTLSRREERSAQRAAALKSGEGWWGFFDDDDFLLYQHSRTYSPTHCTPEDEGRRCCVVCCATFKQEGRRAVLSCVFTERENEFPTLDETHWVIPT